MKTSIAVDGFDSEKIDSGEWRVFVYGCVAIGLEKAYFSPWPQFSTLLRHRSRQGVQRSALPIEKARHRTFKAFLD